MNKTRKLLLAAWQTGYAVSILDAMALSRLASRWTSARAAAWPGRDLIYFCRWQVNRSAVQFQVRALLWLAKKLGMAGA